MKAHPFDLRSLSIAEVESLRRAYLLYASNSKWKNDGDAGAKTETAHAVGELATSPADTPTEITRSRPTSMSAADMFKVR